jgi:hypothetical protein
MLKLALATVAAGILTTAAAAGVTGPAFYVDGQLYRTVNTPTDLSGTGAPANAWDTIYDFGGNQMNCRYGRAGRQRLQRRPLAGPRTLVPVRLRSRAGCGRHEWERRDRQRRGALRSSGRRHSHRCGGREAVRLPRDQAAARLELRKPPRPAPARDELPEPVAVVRDEPVRNAARTPDRAVRPHDMRARVAPRLGQSREQRLSLGVFERKICIPSTIDPSGDTRHEAAEPSAPVVEDHGPPHGSSSDSSSAVMPRRPASAWRTSTVSATGTSSRYASRVSKDSRTSSTAST